MNMPDRPVFELFRVMFPGDSGRHVPGAKETNAAECLQKNFRHLDEIDALLDGCGHLDMGRDLNGFLKELRGRSSDLVDSFITHAIIAYFSDPVVSHALTGKRSPLFPHAVSMDDIDYALLEPVIIKGQGRVDV